MKQTKQFIILLLVTFLCMGLITPIFTQDGSLDLTFGTNGIVTTDIGLDDDYGHSVAIQSDGKILVAGTTIDGNNDRFTLVRYNSDGTLDSTLDSDGIVITSIGGDDDGQSVAIQSDGKIIVAGYSYNASNAFDFALVRYNTDGTLDNTFDSDGIVITPIGSNNDYGYSVAIQPDGKIIVAGESYDGSNRHFALVRYNSNGSLDNTFDSDGIVVTSVGLSNDIGQSVEIQSDGKILVAGYSYNGSYPDFALVRYNSDGSLDNTFDSDGIVTTTVGSSDFGHSVAIQSDGKILVAGDSYIGDNYDITLIRYDSDGSLDTTFNSDGIITTQVGSSDDFGYGIAIQSDEKILVSGDSYNGSSAYEFALIRYNSDGSLDSTFDSNGIAITPIGSSSDVYGYSLAIQPDGKIIVAGDAKNGLYWMLSVVRYNNPSLPSGLKTFTKELPDEFLLSQNYPNPFNPSTKIRFTVPAKSYASLKIYDVLGNEVATLIDEYKPAGIYDVDFDASNLSSGIYLYKLTAGNFIQTKKMILMK